MKTSPFTGKPMLLCKEMRAIPFRKEAFAVVFHFYRCEDSKETFTDAALDTLNTAQVQHLYRKKHNIPFTHEIVEIREKYGLSGSKMSEILGFGANSFRNYENGEMPSEANGRFLQMIKDANEFMKVIEFSTLEEDEKAAIKAKIQQKMAKKPSISTDFFKKEVPSDYNGYRNLSLSRVFAVISFFAEHLKPTKTKLNKLLFYADFSFYKKSCISLTGLQYRAIQFGPVPSNYDVLYTLAAQNEVVRIDVHEFNEKMSEQFLPLAENYYNTILNSDEIAHLATIVAQFRHETAAAISERSHEETAWQQAHEQKQMMNYQFAFDLK